ncbi:MAG TPA: F0F1 ATP synthase subunit A [Pirellulales bacterium]|jgi:F-type H+-transporting ATPase subunit a|nr:F0F1 ATP synthase subunit A [Pirellulales bacterium]
MAESILHIKDSYFFEVPRFIARWFDWNSLDQVPKWLRDAHPELKNIQQWNEALAGKILIPQWFGTPRNLYESASGFCLSKFMILELVACVILVVFFVRLAQKVRKGGVPRGSLWNMAEAILEYLRDNVARPAIGVHDADRFVPLLWTVFLFILTCNLLGMIPWAGSPTGSFGVTLALAAVTFATVLISGMIRFGVVGYWLNQVPHMELPLLFYFLIPIIWLIEVGGMFIRHLVLAVRLLANMVAGHLVLLAILGVIALAAGSSPGQWALVTVIAVVGSAMLSLLELFVAFLQAYVFTFLSALFIGMAIHKH